MASKKFKLLLGLLTLVASSAFSQGDKGGGYSIYDSTVIPASRQPQENEFMNNVYNFPAKPRNMWEVGVTFGAPTISSTVAAVFPTFGWGVHVRKALGYIFSLRAEYSNGYSEGLNWQPTGAANYFNNPAWSGKYTGDIFLNYKTHLQDFEVQGIITLNNVRFHKEKSGMIFYAGGGVGVTLYKAMVNTLDANGHTYQGLFNYVTTNIYNGTYTNRSEVLKALRNGAGGFGPMDNTYETAAQTEGDRHPTIGDNTVRPSASVLVGIEYKLSDRINIALESRETFTKTNLLSGNEWEGSSSVSVNGVTANNVSVEAPYYDDYNYTSLGVNFNLGGKSVQPLWWINPLDYAYSELNNPKHMKLPKPVFDDADGDGVVDQLDREPNTPAGCPVDTHGVTKDTDGDGVPDCKDKQLITPTECQPVDSDGVGHCPPPACCAENASKIDSLIAGGIHHDNCPADYPSISFKAASIGLSADAKSLLTSVSAKLKAAPTCTITLTAYPGASKAQQSLADKRLDAVKKYLVEKLGISEDRVASDKIIGGGDDKTIDIK